MWVLILASGGVVVTLIAPISVWLDHLDYAVISVIKVAVAILLIIAWVGILHKIRNLIFKVH